MIGVKTMCTEEEQEILIGIYEPIITPILWNAAQNTLTKKFRKPKSTEKNMLLVFLKCADCGGNLRYVHKKERPQNNCFSCNNYDNNRKLCPTRHHIRGDDLTEIVTNEIARLTKFVSAYEDEFISIVVNEKVRQAQIENKRNKQQLQELLAKQYEMDNTFNRMYIDLANGKLTQQRFDSMQKSFEITQMEIQEKIDILQEVVEMEEKNLVSTKGFIKLVRKYTRINELTPLILNEFIDKIVVHNKEKRGDELFQKLEICYKMIGKIDLPLPSQEEKKQIVNFEKTEDRKVG